jgi:hypothetical protein
MSKTNCVVMAKPRSAAVEVRGRRSSSHDGRCASPLPYRGRHPRLSNSSPRQTRTLPTSRDRPRRAARPKRRHQRGCAGEPWGKDGRKKTARTSAKAGARGRADWQREPLDPRRSRPGKTTLRDHAQARQRRTGTLHTACQTHSRQPSADLGHLRRGTPENTKTPPGESRRGLLRHPSVDESEARRTYTRERGLGKPKAPRRIGAALPAPPRRDAEGLRQPDAALPALPLPLLPGGMRKGCGEGAEPGASPVAPPGPAGPQARAAPPAPPPPPLLPNTCADRALSTSRTGRKHPPQAFAHTLAHNAKGPERSRSGPEVRRTSPNLRRGQVPTCSTKYEAASCSPHWRRTETTRRASGMDCQRPTPTHTRVRSAQER